MKELENWLEAAKKDRTVLRKMKNAAVASQQFGLAAELRQLEIDLYPDDKEAMELGNSISTLFGMVGMNVNDSTSWLVFETIKAYNEKGGKFSIEDAVKLKVQKEKIFGE